MSKKALDQPRQNQKQREIVAILGKGSKHVRESDFHVVFIFGLISHTHKNMDF